MEFLLRTEEDRKAADAYLYSCPLDKGYRVTILREKKESGRTIPQNRLYRLYVNCIAKDTGNTHECIHRLLRKMFLGTRKVTVGKITDEEPVSTTELNEKEFSSFLDRITEWAATELGIVLPDPKDRYFAEFEKENRNFK